MKSHHRRLDKIEAEAEAGRPTVYRVAHVYADEGAVPENPAPNTYADRAALNDWKESLPVGVEPIVIEYVGPMPETTPAL